MIGMNSTHHSKSNSIYTYKKPLSRGSAFSSIVSYQLNAHYQLRSRSISDRDPGEFETPWKFLLLKPPAGELTASDGWAI